MSTYIQKAAFGLLSCMTNEQSIIPLTCLISRFEKEVLSSALFATSIDGTASGLRIALIPNSLAKSCRMVKLDSSKCTEQRIDD